MPECSPTELLADAKCWYCYGQTDDIYDRLEILLLCKIKEGVLVECNPLDLIEEAFCLTCTIPQQMWPAVKLALLCSIASGGGTGGGIQVYVGRDPAPPDDPTKAALNYPSGGGTLTQWDTVGLVWV